MEHSEVYGCIGCDDAEVVQVEDRLFCAGCGTELYLAESEG